MNDLLVNTQAMIWIVEGQRSVPGAARQRFEAPEGRRLFSVASLWEMAIKVRLGKLELRSGSLKILAGVLLAHGVELLPVLAPEAMDVSRLASNRHHDPFDRLIAARCLRHGLPLLSVDEAFDGYGVERIWSA